MSAIVKKSTLIFVLVLILTFTAACRNTKTSESIIASGEHYDIVLENNTFFLSFHSTFDNPPPSFGSVAAPTVIFSSLKEMKDKIMTNNFTKDELSEIYKFGKQGTKQFTIHM